MDTFRTSLSRRSLFALPLLAALPAAAQTETFPNKPIRIIVPFAPGGSGDITARLVGKYIEEKTGQPFVVENKPGANGIVGAMSVKVAPPDGYTLMLATTSTNAANVHMYKNPGYDPEKDFSVVGIIGSSGTFLVVPADSPYKTLADLLADAKARPGKLNFGYFNASSQVPAEVLGKKAGVDWQGVGYKAIGNAWNDLYGGAINFMFVDLTAGRGQVVDKKARALAISLPSRSPLYPDIPVLSETFPGFTSTGFLAIAVPKATPLPIQQRLNTLINEAITAPENNKRLTDEFALTARPLTLEQCAAQDREERAKWADYVKIAKIEPQ
ncbi:MAG: tripartite tricarboxylate transporter substrate binding protein [Reyranella sp.]|uniref:Bug family tripartite tricarboxylate transporter substrate binding protein n=1 Tax=Reyranella sp. TaxID=1929291 RepID=UPI001221E829|nr:tripartite tricarboxylate transporter substrate binding protein [Reyranella sp.]TAJ91348.1 MAG: tripartite tricarboxylate transporter substrate binding protein [Reyranella sp.]TBR23280.1 MAG: tripartite tricarboxylate transporter substrate binding protein [Reyranella sp.]